MTARHVAEGDAANLGNSRGAVWISCSSHRARGHLFRVCGKVPSYGIWPDKGWPRGDYYKVTPEQAEALRDVKGLRVMAKPPSGGRLFERWSD